MVDPGRLTLDNFFAYVRAIKEEIKRQNEARMSPEERMLEATRRQIDDMLAEQGGDDEEFIDDEPEQTPEEASQQALLGMLGVTPMPNAGESERFQESVLQKIATGYGR